MAMDMREAMGRLTAQLGIAPLSDRAGVEEAVDKVLYERNLDATVASIRWGVLELHCDAQTAQLLRFDRDVVLAAVQLVAPAIRELQVRVVRPKT
jgi:hypothetical protein